MKTILVLTPLLNLSFKCGCWEQKYNNVLEKQNYFFFPLKELE